MSHVLHNLKALVSGNSQIPRHSYAQRKELHTRFENFVRDSSVLPKEILLQGCDDAYNLPHQLRMPTAVPGRTTPITETHFMQHFELRTNRRGKRQTGVKI